MTCLSGLFVRKLESGFSIDKYTVSILLIIIIIKTETESICMIEACRRKMEIKSILTTQAKKRWLYYYYSLLIHI
jgi:hypothetical protein